MKIIIPQIPPSMNKYSGRTNYREYQKVKRDWELIVKAHCKRPNQPIEPAKVTIRYHFKDKRRQDLDNLVKLLLDGLVKNGVLVDDCWTKLPILVLEGYCDPKFIRTEIEVTKL